MVGGISAVWPIRSNVATIFGDVSLGALCAKLLSHDPKSIASRQQVDLRMNRFPPRKAAQSYHDIHLVRRVVLVKEFDVEVCSFPRIEAITTEEFGPD